MADTALVVSPRNPDLLMPAFSPEQAASRVEQFKAFVRSQLKEGVDYTPAKGAQLPALKKAGAEKLGTFFGHKPKFTEVEKILDWTGEFHGGTPLFAYTYTCTIERDGIYLGQASGHCNTWESRYRWRWLSLDQIPPNQPVENLFRRDSTQEEFLFAIQKKTTTGQYGKPMEYWLAFEAAIKEKRAEYFDKSLPDGRSLPACRIPGVQYRVPNPDPYDGVNTALKISQKRAFVAAELIVCNASDFFTQDLDEDHEPPAAPPPPPREPARNPAASSRSQQAEAAGAPTSAQVQTSAQESDDINDSVPEPVQKIWQRMSKQSREQRMLEFAGLKKALMERRGDDAGQACYYHKLSKYRVQHASQFQNLGDARRCILDLWYALQSDPEPPSREAEPSAVIDHNGSGDHNAE
jgi:hypothetical protein